MNASCSSMKILLTAVVLFTSPASGQMVTFTAGDEQQQCLVLGCCDFDCCGPGTSWDTSSEYCVVNVSSQGFNGSFPSDYKQGCVERVCCDDACCDVDTFYDEDLQSCVFLAPSSPIAPAAIPPITLAPFQSFPIAMAPTVMSSSSASMHTSDLGDTRQSLTTPTGAVVGLVFEDTNNNGQRDPGEPGIPNVAVVITDNNGDTQTLTTNINGEYRTIAPAGPIVIDIDETTLRRPFEQTVGTNPTTVTVLAGGVVSDQDGYFFPPQCRGDPEGTDKRIEITAFRNNRPSQLKGFATIDANPSTVGWRSKAFKRGPNEMGATAVQPKNGHSRIPRGKQTIKVGLARRKKGKLRVPKKLQNTLKAKDWHLTVCFGYSVRIFKSLNTGKTTSCFATTFAPPEKRCSNIDLIPNPPFLEWRLDVYSVPV